MARRRKPKAKRPAAPNTNIAESFLTIPDKIEEDIKKAKSIIAEAFSSAVKGSINTKNNNKPKSVKVEEVKKEVHTALGITEVKPASDNTSKQPTIQAQRQRYPVKPPTTNKQRPQQNRQQNPRNTRFKPKSKQLSLSQALPAMKQLLDKVFDNRFFVDAKFGGKINVLNIEEIKARPTKKGYAPVVRASFYNSKYNEKIDKFFEIRELVPAVLVGLPVLDTTKKILMYSPIKDYDFEAKKRAIRQVDLGRLKAKTSS